jgi:hypothetical protein
MNIQSIQKTTALIALATLTALYKGLALFGAGIGGLPLTFDEINSI